LRTSTFCRRHIKTEIAEPARGGKRCVTEIKTLLDGNHTSSPECHEKDSDDISTGIARNAGFEISTPRNRRGSRWQGSSSAKRKRTSQWVNGNSRNYSHGSAYCRLMNAPPLRRNSYIGATSIAAAVAGPYGPTEAWGRTRHLPTQADRGCRDQKPAKGKMENRFGETGLVEIGLQVQPEV